MALKVKDAQSGCCVYILPFISKQACLICCMETVVHLKRLSPKIVVCTHDLYQSFLKIWQSRFCVLNFQNEI